MDRKVILERIKDSFSEAGKKPRNLQLPSKQKYIITDDSVEIHLSSNVVDKNMQEDASAFEGWAIVLMVWGNFKQVTLFWESPIDINDGHYQRFLFRVQNFELYNKAWFKLSDNCKSFLCDLKIKPDHTYFLNSPSKNRKVDNPHHKEAILEYRFAFKDLHDSIKNLIKAKFIERQLPVGVFKDYVKNADENKIFTKGKSAIDLWGLDNSNDLLIFELKADHNNKVGIISELFFYVCVMQKILSGRFKHENLSENLSLITNAKRINAYFLAYDLHPLVYDKMIIDELNKMNPDQVEYHFIRINDNESLELIF